MSSEREQRYSQYAHQLHERFQRGMLHSLQGLPNWLVWRSELVDGRHKKAPYNPNARNARASISIPQSWGTVEQALTALASGEFTGLYVAITPPFVLIDKDAKEDMPLYDTQEKKIVSPLALRILQTVPSYAELSPHNGLHILAEGTLQRGIFKTKELEMYTHWFSTITLRHLSGTPLDIVNAQDGITILEDEFHPPVPERKAQNTGGVMRGGLTALPAEAAEDRQLQALLSGDLSSVGGDHSRGDWNALMKLLHWTGDDIALTKAIFLASPLGQRAKAQEGHGAGRRGSTTYVDRTIERIREMRYNPPMER